MKPTPLRYIVTLVLVIALSIGGFSQDQIFLKSGEKIEGKVTEVGTDLIKYKSKVNPEGPVYSKNIRDILLVSYANGTTELYNKKEKSAFKQSFDSIRFTRSIGFNIGTVVLHQLELDFQVKSARGIIGVSVPIVYRIAPNSI